MWRFLPAFADSSTSGTVYLRPSQVILHVSVFTVLVFLNKRTAKGMLPSRMMQKKFAPDLARLTSPNNKKASVFFKNGFQFSDFAEFQQFLLRT